MTEHQELGEIEVPAPDEWRQLYQALPKGLYDRLLAQLQRVALANGIAPEIFMADSKFKQAVGPRVMVWEILILLCERTENNRDLQV